MQTVAAAAVSPVRTAEVSYPQNSNRVRLAATALQLAFRKYWSQSADGPACPVVRHETASGFACSRQKNRVVFTRLHFEKLMHGKLTPQYLHQRNTA
jgi:hypothetical protein